MTCAYHPNMWIDRPLIIADSHFENNIAEISASSVAVHNRNLTIRDTQFVGNAGTAVLFETTSITGEDQLVVRLVP